jgi:hypothetical protein
MRIGQGVGPGRTAPESKAGINPVPLSQIRLAGTQTASHQPCTLCEENQQQDSGPHLRLANALTHEKSPRAETECFTMATPDPDELRDE